MEDLVVMAGEIGGITSVTFAVAGAAAVAVVLGLYPAESHR